MFGGCLTSFDLAMWPPADCAQLARRAQIYATCLTNAKWHWSSPSRSIQRARGGPGPGRCDCCWTPSSTCSARDVLRTTGPATFRCPGPCTAGSYASRATAPSRDWRTRCRWTASVSAGKGYPQRRCWALNPSGRGRRREGRQWLRCREEGDRAQASRSLGGLLARQPRRGSPPGHVAPSLAVPGPLLH